jgi:sugar diacid utilization regulator
MAAYQVGARVFWHHVSAVAVDHGIAPRTIAALAEAVFLFVDRLSSSSAHGYVLAQSEAADDRRRLRDELVALLLSDRADRTAVEAAAKRADWRVPAEVAVVLVGPDNPVAHRTLARMDPTHLVFHRPPLLGAIVASPSSPGRRARLHDALRGAEAVVGFAVSPERLPASLHVAEIAARLQRTGVLDDDPVFADEHLDAIIVHRDARMLDALRRRVLAPLDGESAASRERLGETLAAWLWHTGDRQAVAAELHVHPQTVRYRLARLHELFGDRLDDPAVRARLSLALTWGRPDVTVAGPDPRPEARRR